MSDRPQLPRGLEPVPPALDKLFSAILVIAATVMVWLLLGIEPDDRGHGTHEQLGMDPCGWVERMNKPCPTCGVTTSAAHLVHIHPVRAFVTQPFGATLALLGLTLAGLALDSLLRGRSLSARLRHLPYGRILAGMVVLFFASWAYRWFTWEG